MTIVSVVLVAALYTLSASRMTTLRMGDRGRAVFLAQDLMAEITAQAYEDPDFGPGSFGLGADEVGDGSRALWEDVDDYDGWSASPPQTKDGTPLAGFDGWQRRVAVDWVSPNDLSQVVGSDLRVKRIMVTIRHNGVRVYRLTGIRVGVDDTGLRVEP